MAAFHNTFYPSETASLVILRQLGINHRSVLRALIPITVPAAETRLYEAIYQHTDCPHAVWDCSARHLRLWAHWAGTQQFPPNRAHFKAHDSSRAQGAVLPVQRLSKAPCFPVYLQPHSHLLRITIKSPIRAPAAQHLWGCTLFPPAAWKNARKSLPQITLCSHFSFCICEM